MYEVNIVHSLSTLPATDTNFMTELKRATAEDIEQAIANMKASNGQHKTRIKACERELRKRGKYGI